MSLLLKNIKKKFGLLTIIDDIEIEVGDDDFLVLLGPSGCGKSTLLRMIAGLETVTDGTIHLNGERVDHLSPSERGMAFVFQSYALYPHMTVRRNITFPLIMREHKWWFHIPLIGHWVKKRIENSPAVKSLVDSTAETLGLTKVLDAHPRTLSGGQRQRVALGRAMVRKPSAFLMDEPLSNLDAKLRTTMRAEITKLHQRFGGTFVYVTHDQVEAMTMGTKIALLKSGEIQQFGTPREIYEKPANTYVARFIGTPPMNLIEAKIDQGRVTVGQNTMAPPADSCPSGQRSVWLGIRSGAVEIVAEDTPDSVGATVSIVEHVGAESLVALDMGPILTGHEEESQQYVMVTVPGYAELVIGQKIGLRFNLADASYFDKETGKRIE